MAKKTLLERLRDAKTDAERRRLIQKIRRLGTFRMSVPLPVKREYQRESSDV